MILDLDISLKARTDNPRRQTVGGNRKPLTLQSFVVNLRSVRIFPDNFDAMIRSDKFWN